MLRLVVCCGGGMSSSSLAAQFQETITKNKWEEHISFAYMPLLFLAKHQEKFDLALLCPHSAHTAKQLVAKGQLSIPLYIIPARLYGIMRLEPLVEDAVDILKLYEETKENPIHFPTETFMELRRDTSYRKWIKKHPPKETPTK